MLDSNLGRKLANRYELIELIGQGAMGKVYRAEDTLLGGVVVAIKFLSQTLLTDKMRERFVQEATTCAQLGQKSIYVVRVTDYGVSEDDIPFYVMEHLKGDSLSTLINQQPLPIARFERLSRQICLGLQSAHDGIRIRGYDKPVPIIHRDIKPSNILVTREPTLKELAKILDFGIAKLMQADSEQTSSFMGTLAYASPEQMEGKELDNRSDIYSLGIMMFQMLTGQLPLRASSHTFGGWYKAHREQQPVQPSQIDTAIKVPKRLETLVMSCLEKSPANRPQSISEILEALKPLERKYDPGRQFYNELEAKRERLKPLPAREDRPSLPPPNKPSVPPSPDELIYRRVYWPEKSKPVAEVVFPHILKVNQETLVTLWAMMPRTAVDKCLLGSRYNNFYCTMSPHPMVLWLTVLYNTSHGPRWLPYYLDLKTQDGQNTTFLLGRNGSYRVLFFAMENPQKCAHISTFTVASPQRNLLRQWVMDARSIPSLGTPSMSKDILKKELNDNLKGKILQQLESI